MKKAPLQWKENKTTIWSLSSDIEDFYKRKHFKFEFGSAAQCHSPLMLRFEQAHLSRSSQPLITPVWLHDPVWLRHPTVIRISPCVVPVPRNDYMGRRQMIRPHTGWGDLCQCALVTTFSRSTQHGKVSHDILKLRCLVAERHIGYFCFSTNIQLPMMYSQSREATKWAFIAEIKSLR